MKAKVTYREIAKMLVRALPLDGEECRQAIEEYTKAIEAMPEKARFALKAAYIFSSKVPPEEREDMFQGLALTVLEKQTTDESLACRIAGCDWRDWLDKREVRKRHLAGSLNKLVIDDGQEVELADTIVGEGEFEDKVIAELDAQRIWDKLPNNVKVIISKRLEGKRLLRKERGTLFRYRRKYGDLLRELTGVQ